MTRLRNAPIPRTRRIITAAAIGVERFQQWHDRSDRKVQGFRGRVWLDRTRYEQSAARPSAHCDRSEHIATTATDPNRVGRALPTWRNSESVEHRYALDRRYNWTMGPGFFFAAPKPRFRLVIVLALAIGMLGWLVGGALDAPRWVKGLAALLGMAATFAIEPLLARTEWVAAVAASRRRAAPDSIGGTLPFVADLGLDQLRVHPAVAAFPFYERSSLPQALDTLRATRKLLVVGRSMSGKTRLASESVRRLYPGYGIWRPNDGSAVAQLLADGSSVKRTVIWLDDLERFAVAGGLHLAHLDALFDRSNVIVATVRSSVLDQMTDSTYGRPTGADLIPWFGDPVWLVPWSEAEVNEALTTADADLPREAVMTHGLSGYLGGAPLLVRKLNIAQSEGLAAYSILRTVAEVSRCGLAGGLPRSELTRAVALGGDPLSDEAVTEEAIKWCLEPIVGSLALLTIGVESNRITLPDSILEYFEDLGQVAPSDDTWNLVIELASDNELVTVGERAFDAGYPDFALKAWRTSGTTDAAYNLGVTLGDRDDESAWREAEQVLRRVTVDDAYPLALTSLGIVLEKLSGGPESYVPEAHDLYRRAAALDEPVANFNAGTCAIRAAQTEAEAEAERYFRRAYKLGHGRAAGRLAELLADQGRSAEAQELLEVAATSADPDPDVVAAFGELLLDRGEDARGSVYLERAVEAGSDRGRLALAQQIATERIPTDLSRASRLLDELVDAERVPGLEALKALVLIRRGLFDAARSILEAGHEAGDVRCTVELAAFLASKTQEQLGRERVPVLLQDLPSEVVQLLVAVQGPDEGMARLQLGSIYMDVGEVDLAIESLQLGASGAEEYALDAKAQLASALLVRGRAEDVPAAIDLLTGLLEGPNRFTSAQITSLMNNLGAAYRDIGEMNASESMLRDAAERGSVSAMRNIARILLDDPRWWRRIQAHRWLRRAQSAAEAVLEAEDPSTRYELRPMKALVHEPRGDMPRVRRKSWVYRKWLHVRVGTMRRRSSSGPNSIWAVCRGCNLPFEVPSGAHIRVSPRLLEQVAELGHGSAGPCPYCWEGFPVPRFGDALLVIEPEGDLIRVSGNLSRNFRALMTVATDLATGRLSTDEAADWFTRSNLPWARASELMQAAVSTRHASGLLAAAMVMVGPESVTDEIAGSGFAQAIEEVVALLLQFYREVEEIPVLDVILLTN